MFKKYNRKKLDKPKKYNDKRTGLIPKTYKDSIGISTGLLDCYGNDIKTGDIYMLRSYKWYDYFGPVFWNRFQNCFGIYTGLWYGDKNPMNSDNYGKFIAIPNDNGMRMELIPYNQ